MSYEFSIQNESSPLSVTHHSRQLKRFAFHTLVVGSLSVIIISG